MKKLLLIVAMLCSTLCFAQKDVTTFLGIPVDGYKSEMIKKLKAKGYVYNQADDRFVGEFNGMDVYIFLVTNNNKVYRVVVMEKNGWNESQIKIRFNNLVNQFSNNKRYMTLDDYTIPQDERVGYEMTVHKKSYIAQFYQFPDIEKLDTAALANAIGEEGYEILSKYTQEQLKNPSEDMINELMPIIVKFGTEIVLNKSVWCKISEFLGDYFLVIYYDNEYNKANGEDL